jgi:hypothetical protein
MTNFSKKKECGGEGILAGKWNSGVDLIKLLNGMVNGWFSGCGLYELYEKRG